MSGFLFPRRPRRTPIGVDIGGRRILAAQLAADTPWRLEAAARVTRSKPGSPFERADAEMLAGVLDRAGFDGTRLVLAPPQSSLLTAALEMPPRASGAPIDQLARMELARTHKREPTSFEMAVWDLPTPGRGGEGTHVMAVALPHEEAERIAGAFDGVGLDVAVMDVRSCAVARATNTITGPGSGLTGGLDLTWDAAIVTVQQGPAVLFERSIPECAMNVLVTAVIKRVGLDMDAAEMALSPSGQGAESDEKYRLLLQESRGCLTDFLDSLVPEVTRSLSYAAHRYPTLPVESLLVAGEGAQIHGLAQRLSETIDAPARLVRPADVIVVPDRLSAVAGGCDLVAAIGLSQHGGDRERGRAAA